MTQLAATAPLVTQANQHALARMFSVQPVWSRIVSARVGLNLPVHTLLHAGPPLINPRQPPAPIRSVIVLSCLYEGWASNEAQAEALIDSGTLDLLPAQDFGCVTPLAALITSKSSLVEVADASGTVSPVWSLLASGPPPDIRFGSRHPGCLNSMAYRDAELTDTLQLALAQPLDLVVIAQQGLAGGDELHSRTQAATAALRIELLQRLGQAKLAPDALDAMSAMLNSSPGFFLTLWMAACRLYLTAAEDIPHCSLVTRMGANGESVGISLGQQPDVWWTAPATAPVGGRLPGVSNDLLAAGVVGDSAVVDVMGFGGQWTAHAPEVFQSLSDHLPADFAQRKHGMMLAAHPAFAQQEAVLSGLDASQVQALGLAPLVNIGILAANGQNGLLGRGLYEPPVELFGRALQGQT